MAGLQIDPFFLQHDVMRQFTDDAWFALALFREGINAGSSFYGYLCFWRILDLVFPGRPAKRAWLHDVGAKNSVEHQRITEVLAAHPDLEVYLREERLNALKHVGRVRQGTEGRSGPLNPDKPEDLLSATKDVGMMEDFARKAIRHLLAKTASFEKNNLPIT
jgi:methylamine utilization protein MauJ